MVKGGEGFECGIGSISIVVPVTKYDLVFLHFYVRTSCYVVLKNAFNFRPSNDKTLERSFGGSSMEKELCLYACRGMCIEGLLEG